MHQIKTYGLFFLLLFSLPALKAQTLQQDIDNLISHSFPEAHIGVFIQDADSGKILYQHNANKLLCPASNIKMLTAAAALYQLGSEHHYKTLLSQVQNNIYLTFSGAPDFTAENLKQLLTHLKGRTITGDIVIDSSLFKAPYHPAGSNYDDQGWYYDAPSTAVILNGNAQSFEFTSATTLGQPIKIKSDIKNNALKIINNVITVSKDQEKEHCNLNIDIKSNNTLRLYGCLAQTKEPQKVQLAIPEPILYAKQVIKTALQENQIKLQGKIIEGHTPRQAKIIAATQSNNLATILTHMLEESDNLYADSVTKYLAHAITGEGTYKQGVFAIKQILTQYTHLDVEQYELMDGVGTRYNMITPKQLAIFLTGIYQDKKINPIFLNALARMGVSGTLKDRMKKTVLEEHVLAKTGSMHDISALSGYLLLPNNKTVIFSIISNDITGGIAKAKQLEDNILLAIYHQVQLN